MKLACVIPHYNHSATLFDVAAGAKRHLADVRVVDDGSTGLPEDFEARLEKLGVALIRHESNQGKGAALLTAARVLHHDGVTHMIVLDADGQHDPDDLPRFVTEIEKDPDSVVVGCRDFEHAENVPGSSRFGRKFSNFWCLLETGIKCSDTQSGFRAYPVVGLTSLNFSCRRYNFELEALVNLLWAGYALREIAIPVFYDIPGKRISHFDPWKDNLRLSLLHTALVTRRLMPWPHRRIVNSSTTLSASRGNRFGIGFFQLLLKCGGFGFALWFSRIVAWFYAYFDFRAFAVSEGYLKLRFPEDAGNKRKLRKHFHLLLCELAKMLLISYRTGIGKGIPLEEQGKELLPPPKGGAVFVFAHFDCWQAAMELMNFKNERRINIMARPDRNGNFDKYLALRGERNFKVISTDGFSGGLIEASAALERGEAVIVMGDRPVAGAASIDADYLGGKLKLPLSPWMLAARNEVPAVPVFAELKEDPERIVISYRPPITFASAAGQRVRPEELAKGAAEYARELEEVAMRHPYRMFRFGDEKAK